LEIFNINDYYSELYKLSQNLCTTQYKDIKESLEEILKDYDTPSRVFSKFELMLDNTFENKYLLI